MTRFRGAPQRSQTWALLRQPAGPGRRRRRLHLHQRVRPAANVGGLADALPTIVAYEHAEAEGCTAKLVMVQENKLRSAVTN